MRFVPNVSESRSCSTPYLPKFPSDLNDENLLVSGSQWTESHLRALRVVLLEPLSIDRIIPSTYVPTPGKHAFGDLEKEISRASIDDLKEFSRCKSTMQRNLFYSLFKAISDTITTRPAHVEGTTSCNRDRTPNSEVSSESNEDKCEELSRVMFTRLIDPIVDHINFPAVESGDYTYHIISSPGSHSVRIWFGEGEPIYAKNDGSLFLVRGGKISGSTRYGAVSLASFEAKRRDAAGKHVGAGEEEEHCADILAQEVAELLGQAMENSKQESEKRSFGFAGPVLSTLENLPREFRHCDG